MDTQTVIDLGREAIFITLFLCAPMLITGVVVGLVIGLLQAVTQIQDQTVSFVPKLAAMVVALAFTLPWLLSQFVDYVVQLYQDVPLNL